MSKFKKKNAPRLKKGTLKICGEMSILLHEWRPPNQEEIPDILSDASAEVRSIVLTPAISSSLQTTDRTEPICLTFYQQIDKESNSLEESKLSFLAHNNTFKDVFVLLFSNLSHKMTTMRADLEAAFQRMAEKQTEDCKMAIT